MIPCVNNLWINEIFSHSTWASYRTGIILHFNLCMNILRHLQNNLRILVLKVHIKIKQPTKKED